MFPSVQVMAIAGVVALAAVTGAYFYGDSRGYARANGEAATRTLEATQNHGRQLAAREAEKRKLQDHVNAGAVQRQMDVNAWLSTLTPDVSDPALQEILPDASQDFYERLRR